MSLKIYEYKNCDTCRKALQFLDSNKIKYQKIPIVDEPPSIKELQKMLTFLKAEGGTFKNLFNTSGIMYRELEISQKIKEDMTEKQALELLTKNGKLIKRPFAISEDQGLVGFKKEIWQKYFKNK